MPTLLVASRPFAETQTWALRERSGLSLRTAGDAGGACRGG
jgi:hypothetical protein